MGARRGGLLAQALPGQGHRLGGVVAVAVSADFTGVLLGDGRAADDDLDLIADARMLCERLAREN